jgi:phosphinothricin acetyltransferase
MLTIRPASSDDLPALNAIYNHYVHTDVLFDIAERTLDDAQRWLDGHREPEHPAIVALEDSELAGWASLSPFGGREAYRITKEISVYVAPRLHRRGIGRKLVDAVIEIGKANGVHSVIARITAGNQSSVGLFASMRFAHVGIEREVGFKDGHYLDAVIMQKLLT